MSLQEDIKKTRQEIYEYESYILLADSLLEEAEARLRFLKSIENPEESKTELDFLWRE